MNFQIRKALLIQTTLSVFCVLATAIWSTDAVFSATIGCMAGLIPNVYFYSRLSLQPENNDAQQWLAYVYRSEIGKWLVTGLIFMLAFASDYSWHPIVLFVGYLFIQVSGWFVPFIIKGN